MLFLTYVHEGFPLGEARQTPNLLANAKVLVYVCLLQGVTLWPQRSP